MTTLATQTHPADLIQQQQPVNTNPTTTDNTEQDTGKRVVLADRYKTKLCKNFMQNGKCPYGHKCMFAHGEHDLRTYEMNMRDGLTTEDSIRLFRLQQRAAERQNGAYSSSNYMNQADAMAAMSLPPQYYQGAPPQQQGNDQQYYPADATEYSSNNMHQYYGGGEEWQQHQFQVQHSGMYFYSDNYYQQCYEQQVRQVEEELPTTTYETEEEGDEVNSSCDSPSCQYRQKNSSSRASSTGSMYRYDPYGAAAVQPHHHEVIDIPVKRGSELREHRPVSAYP